MTKDEAWKAHVEEYDRDRFDSTSRHRRHCFDAGWEAALADTLGMLELIAKRTDETVELGRVTVEYQAGRGTYIYSIHYDDDLRHGWFDVSRAETEALLAGEEKKE